MNPFMIHKNSQPTVFYHLGPFFYYMRECLNCHKTANRIYGIYKQRLIDKKNLVDKKGSEFSNNSLYFDSLLMVVDSHKSTFGNIVDIYGESKSFGTTKEEIMKQNMDCMIPNMQKEFHKEVCDLFLKRPLNSFMGR